MTFEEVVELLGIGELLDRRPHTLSGGERQRVAIGRALLAQPHLLLMDEPLASLDSARKAEILPYLTRLKTALRLPVLYVTHELDEVTRLADAMVLVDAAAWSVRTIGGGGGSRRSAAGVARRRRRVAALSGGRARPRPRTVPAGRAAGPHFWCRCWMCLCSREVRIRVPAREVILAGKPPEAISLHNVIAGTVRRIAGDPARRAVMVEVGLPNGAVLARVTPDAIARLGLSPGGPVLALIKSTSIEVLGD